MKVSIVGGGPAGLYLALLLKRADASRDVVVYERNRPDDTFGFGVVFSDQTLGNLEAADPESYAEITSRFAHWDDIQTHVGGEVWTSTGHGFCGLSRKELLLLLQQRCADLGVDLRFETDVPNVRELDGDLIVGADGLSSMVRDTYADSFGPSIDLRPNRFVWLGTTVPFDAFTFYFKQAKDGLFRVHAYRYSETGSTFIVECTGETFHKSGLAVDNETQTIEYLEEIFKEELAGHRLIANRSIWRQFPTVENRSWHHENVVLVGDAAHTAHFSIGSGTKLAMEDAIDLARAVHGETDIRQALVTYEAERRPAVERTQRAAQVSLEWFEGTERYMSMAPIQFQWSLMTRSLRVSHEGLKKRDPKWVAEFEEWFAGKSGALPWQVPKEIGGTSFSDRLLWRDERPAWAEGGQALSDVGQRVLDVGSAAEVEKAFFVRCALPKAEALQVAAAAKAAGATVFIAGCDPKTQSPAGRFAGAEIADIARNELGIATCAEGPFRSLDDISTVVAAGRADLCLAV